MKRKEGRSAPHGGRRGKFSHRLRQRAVRLHLEEQYPVSLVSEELGVGKDTLYKWIHRYQQYGEAGLEPARSRKGALPVAEPVKEKIVELKRARPFYGARRIADVLKRFFLLPVSLGKVRQSLREEGLWNGPVNGRSKNPAKPRFFERARPNQMWQSDIMSFRLGGKAAYLIGFMDDYSRYVTGLGLFRSQTAENVLETYRRAAGEYGVPKEMLTDNGRQYVNWRGRTKFQREMEKDRIHHIKSRPHHPMTLGKLERFWKSILEEFLLRAQFGSFEEAAERIGCWTKYYNYKRPHQGIGGLCPADRFFEINHELRQTLEQGVADNLLELALRGRPADPFYMVGRMGEQSVVIRAEKGKLRMLVDGEENKDKELIYELGKGAKDGNGNGKETDTPAGAPVVHGAGKEQGGVVGVGGAAQSRRGLPGAGGEPGAPGRMAGAGPGGDDGSAGSGRGPSAGGRPEQPAGETADEKDGKEVRLGQTAGAVGQGAAAEPQLNESAYGIGSGKGVAAGADHCAGARRPAYGHRRGAPDGDVPQDLLPVGEAGAGGNGGGAGGTAQGADRAGAGPGEGGAETAVGAGGERESHLGAAAADKGAD